MTIVCRVAQPGDAESIYQVGGSTWASTYVNKLYNILESDAKPSRDASSSFDYLVKRREEEIRNNPGSYRVAMDGSQVIGYAGGKKHQEHNELFAVYVLSGYQGKGVGTSLVNKVFGYLGFSKNITVQVIGYNEKAINFYKKLGFQFSRQLPDRELVKGKFVPEIEMVLSV